MNKLKGLSKESRDSLAILAVDDISVTSFGYEVLLKLDSGEITYAQAKRIILERAKTTERRNCTNKGDRA